MDFFTIKDVLQSKKNEKNKYVSREFQDFGYRLAEELSDTAHKSLYIKLAKNTPRSLLEEAKSFVLNNSNAKNKGALFMWKLKELKGEFSQKNDKT